MSPDPPDRAEGAGAPSWLLLAALLVVPTLVFSNTLGNELHLDDVYRISQNHEVEEFWPPWRHFTDPRTSATLPQLVQYRPLLPLSLSLGNAVSDALGIERLAAYHLGNLACHLAAVVLLYYLFRELLHRRLGTGGARAPAFFGALLFAVHPVSGVPVNYICARDLLLMNVALIGALLVFARMRRRGDTVLGWCATCFLFALSMLAKQNPVGVFLAIPFLDLLLLDGRRRPRSTALGWLPFLLVAAGYFAWTELALGFSDLGQLKATELSPFGYACTMLDVHVFYYLRNFVWPFELRMLPRIERHHGLGDIDVLIGLVVVTTSLVGAAWLAHRRAYAGAFSILAYWILFAPTSSVKPFRYLATDYRQYPSLPWLCLLVALGLWAVLPRRGATAALLAITGYFGVSAYFMNDHWATGETAWAQAVRYGAEAQGEMNYGHAMSGKDPVVAEKHFREALRLYPEHYYARINLGLLLIRTGRGIEGIDLLEQARDQRPNGAMSHYYLAEGLVSLGRAAEGLAARRRAADLDPRNAEYVYRAALDCQRHGTLEDSLPYLEQLDELSSGYRDADFLMGYALQDAGRWEEALPFYERFLASQPRHFQAWVNVGFGHLGVEAWRPAVDAFERALEIDPAQSGIHCRLADAHRGLGDEDAAARHDALCAP